MTAADIVSAVLGGFGIYFLYVVGVALREIADVLERRK